MGANFGSSQASKLHGHGHQRKGTPRFATLKDEFAGSCWAKFLRYGHGAEELRQGQTYRNSARRELEPNFGPLWGLSLAIEIGRQWWYKQQK